MKGLKFHKGIFPLIWVKAWRMRIKKGWKFGNVTNVRETEEEDGFLERRREITIWFFLVGEGTLSSKNFAEFSSFSFDFKGEKNMPKINKICFCSFTDAFMLIILKFTFEHRYQFDLLTAGILEFEFWTFNTA